MMGESGAGVLPLVSIVVVSRNSADCLRQTLSSIHGHPGEVIVVDNASEDGGADLVRDEFPDVRLLRLAENRGYGAACNEGISGSTGRFVLILNADAWPVGAAIARLAEYADENPRIAVVGPRLVNPDGTLQRSVRGFPTRWRLATEYFFLRWLAPRTRLVNAFYGENFDHRTERDAEFLVGAALLLRRDAIADVGAFDTSFFMFNEEVDLCYRMRRAGWKVAFVPGAEFVHVGGASTRLEREGMFREQLRSHLRFLAKHEGLARAEQARRMLVWAMRLRSVVFHGERARISREAADWLGSADVETLLGGVGRS